MIENGRYNSPKIPRNDRLRPFCQRSVESEVYFLLDCNKYANIRKSYISKHINNKHQNQDDLSTIIILLNQDNIYSARGMSNYIEKSLVIRKNDNQMSGP